MRLVAISASGVALVVLLVLFALLGSHRGEKSLTPLGRPEVTSSPLPVEPSPAPGEERNPVAPSATEAAAAVQPLPKVRDFLAEYWGPRWKDIEARMLARGINLDLEYTYSPWEEAAPEIEKDFGYDASGIHLQIMDDWPQEETVQSLHDKYPLLGIDSDAKLQVVIDAAAPFNDELRRMADSYVEQTAVHLREKWNRGDYIKAPYTFVGVEAQERLGFYSCGLAAKGWAVGIIFTREEYPEMVQLVAQSRALAERRDQAIFRAAKSW